MKECLKVEGGKVEQQTLYIQLASHVKMHNISDRAAACDEVK